MIRILNNSHNYSRQNTDDMDSVYIGTRILFFRVSNFLIAIDEVNTGV